MKKTVISPNLVVAVFDPSEERFGRSVSEGLGLQNPSLIVKFTQGDDGHGDVYISKHNPFAGSPEPAWMDDMTKIPAAAFTPPSRGGRWYVSRNHANVTDTFVHGAACYWTMDEVLTLAKSLAAALAD